MAAFNISHFSTGYAPKPNNTHATAGDKNAI